ncbi:unnamed protein product [Larinioides sclopetarius]|uniref:Uncharacterized protein n=1 Tax=Larinioides sclopetarius TaxID=280406 RepID=A0AAV1YUW1_9ARAC
MSETSALHNFYDLARSWQLNFCKDGASELANATLPDAPRILPEVDSKETSNASGLFMELEAVQLETI